MFWGKRGFTKYFKMGPYGFAATIIIICSVIFRLILTAFTYPEVNSDEGSMGIEAMHIAFQGAHPIYFYGQDYMGVLEAYLAAPLFRLFGVSAFTLRFGMLILFAVFMLAMYWLGSLLYSKKLALVSLGLLTLATADMLIQQLRAVGGAIETIMFGALMLVLAYRLASTAGKKLRWRYLAFVAWGFCAGLALWVHFLSLPFILCSGLLILVFCRHEWRSPASICLILGFLLGGFLLIPGYKAFATVLNIHSAGNVTGVHTSLLQQIISTVFWGIPLTTGVQPLCSSNNILSYQAFSASTIPCNALQGAWGIGYLVLLGFGLTLAGGFCWRLWKQQRVQKEPLSEAEQQQSVLHFSRLMLLLSAVLLILLYVSSPLSGEKPWSTRYLVGLLVATPGILWPLWRWSGLENLQLSLKRSTRWLSRAAIALIFLVWFSGTVYTVTTVPAAVADTQQQSQLVQDLLKLKVTHVYLEYWTCYRMLFQSQEQILCARPPYAWIVGANRYQPDADPVIADPNSAYMFPLNEPEEINAFEQDIHAKGEHFKTYKLDGMMLYIPTT